MTPPDPEPEPITNVSTSFRMMLGGDGFPNGYQVSMGVRIGSYTESVVVTSGSGFVTLSGVPTLSVGTTVYFFTDSYPDANNSYVVRGDGPNLQLTYSVVGWEDDGSVASSVSGVYS